MIFSEKDYDEMTVLGRVHFGGAKLAVKNDKFREFFNIEQFQLKRSRDWDSLGIPKKINDYIKQMDTDGKLKKIPNTGGFDHKWAKKVKKSREDHKKAKELNAIKCLLLPQG